LDAEAPYRHLDRVELMLAEVTGGCSQCVEESSTIVTASQALQ
jgi:hypothetical protein